MQHTKITITKEEYDVMTNSDFLIRKAEITRKIKILLLELQDEIFISSQKFDLPAEVMKLHGKISSGENYNGLPYLILDFPRYFDKENIFAFRSMFWWGNYFLFTLHLQGKYFNKYGEDLIKNLKKTKTDDLFINTTGNVWKHHIGDDNLIQFKDFEINSGNADFLKIAARLELDRWGEVPGFGSKTFMKFISCLRTDNMS